MMMIRCNYKDNSTENEIIWETITHDHYQLTISDFIRIGRLGVRKLLVTMESLFSRNFFVFCERLRCLFTNSGHVLLEKDVDKVKCMGLGQIRTFDESDTSEFFIIYDIQLFEFGVKSNPKLWLSEKIRLRDLQSIRLLTLQGFVQEP